MRRAPLVLLVLCVSSADAVAAWVDHFQAGSFEIRSEFRLRDVEQLVLELAELEQEMESTLGLNIEPASIQLNLFAHRRSYRAHVRQVVPVGADRKALFVKRNGQIRVYAYRSLGFNVDVRHECTHALLHSALPFVPLWLDEGIAEYFEVPENRRLAGHDHLKSLRWSTRFWWAPNLPKLESHESITQMSAGDYRHAWAWVHFLLNESKESRAILVEYLRRISAGEPPGPLSAHIASRMPHADQRLLKHLKTFGSRENH